MDISEIKIKAIVIGEASPLMEKHLEGGKKGSYVLHTCKVLAPEALKGQIVTGNRTILNSKGETNKDVSVNQEITLYPRQAKDSNAVFFEISSETEALSPQKAFELLMGIGVTTPSPVTQDQL